MKYLFFIVFFALSLFSKTIEAKYDVTYGLFGKVGDSIAKLIKKKNNYKIIVKAEATGFAKILSNSRVESYTSEGVIKNGILIPKIYKKVRETLSKKDIKIYTFDHDKKKIYVHIEKYRHGKLESISDEVLNYYAKDDILSLYFNIKRYLDFNKNREKTSFYAVGGNRKDGRVDVYLPKGKELSKLRSLFDNEKGLYVDVIIHQKIFASKEGRLHIVMDEKTGVAKKALLKDVIFWGDITGILDNLDIRH